MIKKFSKRLFAFIISVFAQEGNFRILLWDWDKVQRNAENRRMAGVLEQDSIHMKFIIHSYANLKLTTFTLGGSCDTTLKKRN
jgi:hypothetical protein